MSRNLYVLTEEDMIQIYKTATTTRDRFIAYLLFETGIRLSECAALYHEDILWNHIHKSHTIQLRDRGRLQNGGFLKTGERTLTISSSLFRVYEDYTKVLRQHEQAITGHIFVNVRGKREGEPMTLKGLQTLVKKWQREMDFPLSACTFRYSHGCRYYDETGSIEAVHERMGHESVDVSIERYITFRHEDIKLVK
ncbi:hypothetical protein CN918_29885 [Priestia megaterium]|nr:hypothetical protein CN918_29885 [Priestia megaterium]